MMRWSLAGYCGLALISLSVALNISQKPRYYGLKTDSFLSIYCKSSSPHQKGLVEWFKADRYNAATEERIKIQTDERIIFRSGNISNNAFLDINKLQIEDSGVYFCKINETWGPGTQVNIVRPIHITEASYRSKMKDGLIVLQGLLLAACIAAIILRKQKLIKKRDSIYEEPEADHIYEGLAIETCGGGLYEDLTVYQTGETEAPWE